LGRSELYCTFFLLLAAILVMATVDYKAYQLSSHL
jgi:hypothetical protein